MASGSSAATWATARLITLDFIRLLGEKGGFTSTSNP